MNNKTNQVRAYVVTADMGLGHQRAAHPLAYMAEGGIITAGDPQYTDPSEMKFWKRIRITYEFVSRLKGIPLIGNFLFDMMDKMLKIPPLYPLRDLSKPSINNHLVDYVIKRGLGNQLLKKMNSNKLPMITTFYAPSLAADYHHYPQIYSVICDADLNRVWVATKPRESNIFFFAPCGRVMRRLRGYGVPDDRIFITGFPLPKSNIGGTEMPILKSDFLRRVGRLDPKGKFAAIFGSTVREILGSRPLPVFGIEPVTITFAVGGAGAQVEIGQQLASSLKESIMNGEFRLKLIAGVNRRVEKIFNDYLYHIGLSPALYKGVEVVCEDIKSIYFDRFNSIMRETDILWTKPSELSFYSALGIPIIMAPTIGSQEDKNMKWLMDKSCAIPQYKPHLAAEWLRDMLKDGILAEKAFNGFMKNRKLGVYKIEEVLATGNLIRQTDPMKR